MFIKRDMHGRIVGVCEIQSGEFNEHVTQDSSELLLFLKGKSKDLSINPLESSDTDLARVLEDLIDILTERGIIHFTDLPTAAQTKLNSRQAIRKIKNSLDLLDNEEEDLI